MNPRRVMRGKENWNCDAEFREQCEPGPFDCSEPGPFDLFMPESEIRQHTSMPYVRQTVKITAHCWRLCAHDPLPPSILKLLTTPARLRAGAGVMGFGFFVGVVLNSRNPMLFANPRRSV